MIADNAMPIIDNMQTWVTITNIANPNNISEAVSPMILNAFSEVGLSLSFLDLNANMNINNQ